MPSLPTFEDDLYEYRVDGRSVDFRFIGARKWTPISHQELLKFGVDSPLWDWLRSHGITRASPSGYIAEEDRNTVQVKLRLLPEIASQLTELATASNIAKSELVASWVMSAYRTMKERVPRPSEPRHTDTVPPDTQERPEAFPTGAPTRRG
jgi:hypothetical protein